jgi:N-acetylmuramoyl-L-alanine amidase
MEVGRRELVHGSLATGLVAGLTVLGTAPAQAASLPTLRPGSRGSAVVTLQKRLNALGYWCGAANGVYGALTVQAVYAVQKVSGLVRDGVCGPRTWAKVNAGVRPAARTRGTGIEVDLGRQVLLAVAGGRVRLILNTSTGSGERYYSRGTWRVARTPRGSFSIYRRYSAGWQTGPLGSMWRPTYFSGGFAIHGSSSIPPYPASHGCCRLSTSSMDMLWAGGWVSLRRPVTIY